MPLIWDKVIRASLRALNRLTKQQRIVIYLRIHHQLETEEIAKEMQITPTDVQRIELLAWIRLRAAAGIKEHLTDVSPHKVESLH